MMITSAVLVAVPLGEERVDARGGSVGFGAGKIRKCVQVKQYVL